MKSYLAVSVFLFSVLLLCAHGKDEPAGNGNLAALTAQFHSIINELGERGLNTKEYEAQTAALLKKLEQSQYQGAARANISLDWFAGALANAQQTEPTRTIPLRIMIVVSSFEGMYLNSGIGTFYAALSDFLVSHGHKVSILYTRTDGADAASKTFSRWQASYAKKGISVAKLEPSPIHITSAPLTQKSYQVYQYLKEHQQEFDAVHFPDWEGPGYFTVLAKHQGLAFASKTFIVGLHGPWRWVKNGNQLGLNEQQDFETDWLERRSVELADFVITPSADLPSWLASQGWSFSNNGAIGHGHQMTLMPFLPGKEVRMVNEGHTANRDQQVTVAELVFFGRLEARKGLVLFADSLDMLVEQRPELRDLKVTFLGRSTDIDGQAATKYLSERAAAGKWPFKLAFLTHKDRKAALEYLKEEGRGRVAVIPSLMDNSPYTIYECLYTGIPFIASNLPSIAALISPSDRDTVLFPTTEASSLVSKMEHILDNGIVAAQGVLSAESVIKTWESFYHMIAMQMQVPSEQVTQTAKPLVSVCITHFNRPELLAMALASVKAQDYPLASIEIVLVDDGSTSMAALDYIDSLQETFAENNWQIIKTENKYLGAARNTAARAARGDYLIFLDDDNLGKSTQISTYVSVAQVTGADVLTAAHDVFRGYGLPVDLPPGANVVSRSLPLGPAIALGVFNNCFGDANFFVKRHVFAQTGGFTEEKGVGQEDYEFLADAVLSGLHLEAIPEPLLYYRMHNQSEQMISLTDPVANQVRSARPFRAVLDESPETSETLTLLARRHSLRYTQDAPAACNLTVTSVQPQTILAYTQQLLTFKAHSMTCEITEIKLGSYACNNITQNYVDSTFSCITSALPFPGLYSISLKYNDATTKLSQTIIVETNKTAASVAALMIKYKALIPPYLQQLLLNLFAQIGGFSPSNIQLIDDVLFDPSTLSTSTTTNNNNKRSIMDATTTAAPVTTEYHDMRFSLLSYNTNEPASAQATNLIQASMANRDKFQQIGVTILDFNVIGQCDDNQNCQCTPSYTGEGCGDLAQCPGNCTNNGACVDGPYKRVCNCNSGWTGKACDIPTCPQDCNGHGACKLTTADPDNPTCICNTGFSGPACNTSLPCPKGCSGNGVCDGTCKCNVGWTGDDCGQTVQDAIHGDTNKSDKADGVTIGMSIAAGVAGILLIVAIALGFKLRALRL